MSRRPHAPGNRPDPAASARGAAVHALIRVLDGGAPLEAALAGAPGHAGLDARDRAFARLLAATALRHLGEISIITDACLARPLPARARGARALLALGIAQLLFLGTPPHAAVGTAVALAPRIGAGPFKGLVNAVLRRVARDGAGLLSGIDGARVNTPDWLWQSWSAAWGEDLARRIAAASLTEAPLDITLRESSPEAAAAWGERLDATVMPTGTLRRKPGGAVTELPGFAEGTWWVQDAAAALPARLFPDLRRRRLLDLCAAPGGKTLQLAAAGADVTAVDLSAERLQRLSKNLTRTGLAARLVETDARAFTDPQPFDGVLLDAPCTATGTLRRHPDIARIKGADDVSRTVPVQEALLAAAARLVRPGGCLVYSVCSLEPEEGERRIDSFLRDRPDYRLVPIGVGEIDGIGEMIAPSGALRSLPCHWADRGGIDGFYAVRLQRSGEAAT